MFPLLRLYRRRLENRVSIRNRMENGRRFNSFNLSAERFTELYRVNKHLARSITERLRPHIHNSRLSRGVKVEEKVLIALRYYATGSYQRCIGEHYNSSVSQTSVHRYVHEIKLLLINEFGDEYIKFPQTPEERRLLKQKFMENFQFPGVVGVIDCSHIAILKPKNDEQNFINRKGFHSLNTQIICDPDLKILNVNSNYGGSTHDSFIFNHSAVNNVLRNIPNELCWLIGDSGYTPYVMTPVRNAVPNSPEARYNQALTFTRNCIERCIGVLKSRFRCLLKEHIARYQPHFVAELIKICCILHNMCIDEDLPNDFGVVNQEIIEDRNHRPVANPIHDAENNRRDLINLYFQ